MSDPKYCTCSSWEAGRTAKVKDGKSYCPRCGYLAPFEKPSEGKKQGLEDVVIGVINGWHCEPPGQVLPTTYITEAIRKWIDEKLPKGSEVEKTIHKHAGGGIHFGESAQAVLKQVRKSLGLKGE